MIDEFTRQALATAAARSFTADDTTILLDTIVAETGRQPPEPAHGQRTRTHRRRDAGLVPIQ